MRARIVIALATVIVIGAACGGSDGGGSPDASRATGATSSEVRPSSPAELTIVSPKNGATIHDTSVAVTVDLANAVVVPQTTKEVSPDEGHLHVYLDDALISMTEGTDQEITDLEPGVHRLQVEFVAADHVPFEPRVVAVATFNVAP